MSDLVKENEPVRESQNGAQKEGASCSVVGCDGAGMCPGVALMIGFLVGSGLTVLTGIQWLMPATTVVLGGVLISGIHKRLWRRRGS